MQLTIKQKTHHIYCISGLFQKTLRLLKRKKWIEWKALRLSVSYKTINVKDIEDIHKYLMEKLVIV